MKKQVTKQRPNTVIHLLYHKLTQSVLVTGATGFIACIDTTGTYVTLHNVQETFVVDEVCTEVGGAETLTVDSVGNNGVVNFTPDKQNPLCTFAGTQLFVKASGTVIDVRFYEH